MTDKIIDGEAFGKLASSGAAGLKAKKQEVNDLNVFPIPDGDTGDNMYMTINGGVSYLKAGIAGAVGDEAQTLAKGMLLNARGNSGVILSQFFAGLAAGLEGIDKASVADFGRALTSGVKQAYSAVVQPVEGTVLTVAREAVDYAVSRITDDTTVADLFTDCVAEMKRSLERTPTLLEVLAEAGVVDSGGAGLLAIFEGMLGASQGKAVEAAPDESTGANAVLDFSKFNENSEMTFGYCTEFLLQLQNSKVDAESFDVQVIIDYLSTIGDSIVAVKTGTVVKIHVHTMTPYKALEFCHSFGEYLTVKIENMTLQHSETGENFATNKKKAKKKRPHKEFALVTVAIGKGLVETFTELGADIVIDGGQGKNPSIENFIDAFEEVNADHIFVLPNNSNIIMAARQAKELFADSDIHIIETKNFGEAYSILSMLDYSSKDAEAIAADMREYMKSSVTGMITSSIRSVTLDGVDVKEGEYIGFTNKTMLASSPDKTVTFKLLTEKLDTKSKEFMIVFMGEDVTENEQAAVEAIVSEQYPNVEFYALAGGQEIYDFIIILE